jgi:ATP-dependent Clp protease protease subunit
MAEQLKRTLILSDYVEMGTVKPLIQAIYDINMEDLKEEEKLKDYKRKPIHLIVNSFGGSVYDGFALIGAIELSKTPVWTICLGSAMSMGLPILLAGHKRFIHRFGTVMYHEVSSFVWGKLDYFKQEVTEMQRLQTLMDDMITEKTNIMQDKLEEVKNRKGEWYITADDAKKLGIVDAVIDANDPT